MVDPAVYLFNYFQFRGILSRPAAFPRGATACVRLIFIYSSSFRTNSTFQSSMYAMRCCCIHSQSVASLWPMSPHLLGSMLPVSQHVLAEVDPKPRPEHCLHRVGEVREMQPNLLSREINHRRGLQPAYPSASRRGE